jgi:hypothetical protein
MYHDTKAFTGNAVSFTFPARGYQPLYHADTVNHCPGCGHTHWHIGRQSAECAFCETALPLAANYARPNAPLFWFRGSSTAMPVAA